MQQLRKIFRLRQIKENIIGFRAVYLGTQSRKLATQIAALLLNQLKGFSRYSCSFKAALPASCARMETFQS